MRCEIKLDKNLASDSVRDYFAKQMGELSPRFDSIVRRLIITGRDINGPRGGNDKECAIFAYLANGKPIRIAARASDLYQAVDLVVEKAKVRIASHKVHAIARRRGVESPKEFSQSVTLSE
jgi:ribosome-associated translation inhibitor RaiA